MKIGIFFGKR